VVTEFLGKNGLRINAMASGADLKRSAQQNMPDLAILDVHLGEAEDGLPWRDGCGPARAGSASSC